MAGDKMNELYHHGIKGQKWGVRRYQYADGSLTPAGEKRYKNPSGKYDRISVMMSTKVTAITNNVKTQITGKQYVDTYLKKGTTFSEYKLLKSLKILHSTLPTRNKILISTWDCLERI